MLAVAWTLVWSATSSAQDGRPYCSPAPTPPAPAWQYRNNPPPTPTLLAPGHGTVTEAARPVFSWSPVVDLEGDTVTFWIQIDDDADFSSPEVDSRRGPQTSFVPDRPLAPGTYCWRVRSVDDIEAMSPYTGAFAITIAGTR